MVDFNKIIHGIVPVEEIQYPKLFSENTTIIDVYAIACFNADIEEQRYNEKDLYDRLLQCELKPFKLSPCTF